jgi:hypothetical protein
VSYAIDGRSVSEAEFLVSEETFEKTGHTSYIRPTYRNGEWSGWCVHVAGEPIGKVFGKNEYKLAWLLLEQIRSESL